MKYEHFDQLTALVAERFVSARRHPRFPLTIYNYTSKCASLKPSEWSEGLQDCRGLILTEDGQIVGRPFRKFWNYEQVLDSIPASEPFTIWEKLDGSLGVIANYDGDLIVATRGSFSPIRLSGRQNGCVLNYPAGFRRWAKPTWSRSFIPRTASSWIMARGKNLCYSTYFLPLARTVRTDSRSRRSVGRLKSTP